MSSQSSPLICRARLIAVCSLAFPSAARADTLEAAQAFGQQNWTAIVIGIALGLALGELLRVAASLLRVGWMIVYVWGSRLIRWAVLMGAVAAAVYALR